MKNFTFKINENNYSVKIISHEENTIDIEVNGTSYSVKMKEDIKRVKTPTLVRTPSKSTIEPAKIGASSSKTKIDAPIPGVILSLNVKVGDVVKKNDPLLVLEAMKMENTIVSEESGTITAVHIKVGQQVLQGEVMIELE
jgi:biotin carboxyl carrier protein